MGGVGVELDTEAARAVVMHGSVISARAGEVVKTGWRPRDLVV